MDEHHRADLAQTGWVGDRLAAEGGGQVPEQPGSPEAPPAHDHTVASGGGGHGQGVGRLPEVAVAQHRDGGDRLLEAPMASQSAEPE